jgi:hypothetical protein
VAQRLSHHHLRHGSRDQQTPLWSPHYQTHGCRADRSLDQTECWNGRCAASQASRAVSSMRALRPMCTTGRRPVHRSRAKVSELTPNHRCASSRGISCGGTGISSGSSCCRADGRILGRRRLDGAAMARVAPRRSKTFDAVDRRTPQTGGAWADTGATEPRIYANIIIINHGVCPPKEIHHARDSRPRARAAGARPRVVEDLLEAHAAGT